MGRVSRALHELLRSGEIEEIEGQKERCPECGAQKVIDVTGNGEPQARLCVGCNHYWNP